jgi:hypothetical protein
MDTLFGGVQAGNGKCWVVHRIWWGRKPLKYRESRDVGERRVKKIFARQVVPRRASHTSMVQCAAQIYIDANPAG